MSAIRLPYPDRAKFEEISDDDFEKLKASIDALNQENSNIIRSYELSNECELLLHDINIDNKFSTYSLCLAITSLVCALWYYSDTVVYFGCLSSFWLFYLAGYLTCRKVKATRNTYDKSVDELVEQTKQLKIPRDTNKRLFPPKVNDIIASCDPQSPVIEAIENFSKVHGYVLHCAMQLSDYNTRATRLWKYVLFLKGINSTLFISTVICGLIAILLVWLNAWLGGLLIHSVTISFVFIASLAVLGLLNSLRYRRATVEHVKSENAITTKIAEIRDAFST